MVTYMQKSLPASLKRTHGEHQGGTRAQAARNNDANNHTLPGWASTSGRAENHKIGISLPLDVASSSEAIELRVGILLHVQAGLLLFKAAARA